MWGFESPLTPFAPNPAWVCPVLMVIAACGSETTSSSTKAPDQGLVGASSGLPIERYFPIVHDHLWTYDTTTDDGQRYSLIVRARRVRAAEGELRAPFGTRRFVYTPEGIGLVDRAAFVLRMPLVVGTTWRGEHGGISRIEAVGAATTTAAGRFTDCVVTIEERGGDVQATYTTTFCPDVGIVQLDVDAGMQHERAELRSYGPPVFIGPPGTTLIEP
jgi:hypothetical protein